MASITKRRTSFQVQVRRKGAAPLSKCFKSLPEAKAWARQVESSIDRGASPLASVRRSALPTLGEALRRYGADVVPLKKGAMQEGSLIKAWTSHRLASKKLDSLSSLDLSRYRDEQLRLGKAPATVVRSLAVVSHLYTVAAKDWGLHISNPVASVRKPKANNARSRRPTADELAAVLAQVQSKPVRTFIALAAETAMRRSELFSLTWGQVNLERRTVFLPDTKNGTSRTVVISSRAVALFATVGPKEPSQRVFAFSHQDTPSKAFGRAVKAARGAYERECSAEGIEASETHLTDLRLHDLRHEATSMLFERGLSTVEVASITGHKSLSMLQRYTHITSEHLLTKIG
jgi:integrase